MSTLLILLVLACLSKHVLHFRRRVLAFLSKLLFISGGGLVRVRVAEAALATARRLRELTLRSSITTGHRAVDPKFIGTL